MIFKSKYIYTLFKPKLSGERQSHLNITRLKSRSKIRKALDICKLVIKGLLLEDTKKIDNITASATFNQNINLRNFFELYSSQLSIKYNRDKFPGAFVKTSCGTALLFHSGKIIIVGCKKKSEIKWLLNMVLTKIASM